MKWLEVKKSYGFFEEKIFINESSQIRKFFSIGQYSVVESGCWIENTVIGRFSRVDRRCRLGVPLIFHDSISNHYFSFSEGRNYFKDDSFYQNITTDRFFYDKSPTVYIGSDVRIGEGSIVYAGVKIQDGALIYPNSIVTENVGAYDIVAGNPAKVIGKRLEHYPLLKLNNFNWTILDFSKIFEGNRINYLDLKYIKDIYIKNIDNLEVKTINELKFDSVLIEKFQENKAVIGPSHIYSWRENIAKGIVPSSPYVLYGDVGMSLYGSSFRNFLDWWVTKLGKEAILLVPDFRIGNPFLASSTEYDSRFIDKSLIDDNRDLEVKIVSKNILREFCSLYGNKLKLIFWCLYGREQINIKKGKYLNNFNEYQHPYWNYKEYKEEFSDNVIDLSYFGQSFLNYIEPDETIHPNINGYKLIETLIKSESE